MGAQPRTKPPQRWLSGNSSQKLSKTRYQRSLPRLPTPTPDSFHPRGIFSARAKYLPAPSPNTGKYEPEKPWIRTLFTQRLSVQRCKKLNPLMHIAPKWPDSVHDSLKCGYLDTLCTNRLTATVGTILIAKSSLREKGPYSEFFWCVFSRIPTEYGDLQSKFSMRDNTEQKNFQHWRFLRKDCSLVETLSLHKKMKFSIKVFH